MTYQTDEKYLTSMKEYFVEGVSIAFNRLNKRRLSKHVTSGVVTCEVSTRIFFIHMCHTKTTVRIRTCFSFVARHHFVSKIVVIFAARHAM